MKEVRRVMQVKKVSLSLGVTLALCIMRSFQAFPQMLGLAPGSGTIRVQVKIHGRVVHQAREVTLRYVGPEHLNFELKKCTDKNGSYTFVNLASGDYVLETSVTSRGCGQRDNSGTKLYLISNPLRITKSGFPDSDQVLDLEPGPGSISGRVYSHGHLAQDGEVTLQVLSSGFKLKSPVDENGRFAFNSLNFGFYEVTAVFTNGECIISPHLNIAKAASHLSQDLRFDGGEGIIRGHVYDHGKPMPELELVLRFDSTGFRSCTRTDFYGRYTFEQLQPGAYTIEPVFSNRQQVLPTHVSISTNELQTHDFEVP